jgi:hypothetical protein
MSGMGMGVWLCYDERCNMQFFDTAAMNDMPVMVRLRMLILSVMNDVKVEREMRLTSTVSTFTSILI